MNDSNNDNNSMPSAPSMKMVNQTTADQKTENQTVAYPMTTKPMLANQTMADGMMPNPMMANQMMADPNTTNPMMANQPMADPMIVSQTMADQAMADPMMTNPMTANKTMVDPTTANQTMADQAMTSQAVPNVLMEEPQEGGSKENGMKRQETIVYALDTDPRFEIPDLMERRSFFKKVFTILQLQHVVMMLSMEIFILSTSEPVSEEYIRWMRHILIATYVVFYSFSNARRYMPLNVCALAALTVLMCIHQGLYATGIGHRAILLHLTIIFQISIVICWSQHTKTKFTNLKVTILMLIVWVVFYIIIDGSSLYTLAGGFHVIYAVYDMQLMLSGHHGYNLKPDEHIFAAANIYADIINLVWRLLRWLIFDHFIRLYKFLRICCFADVC